MHEACNTCCMHIYYWSIRRVSFIHVPRLFHTCDIHATWIIHTSSYSFINTTCLIHKCAPTPLYMRHDSFIHATWIIHTSIHSFINTTCLIHTCATTPSQRDSFIHATWLILTYIYWFINTMCLVHTSPRLLHTCGITHSHRWHISKKIPARLRGQ